MHRSRVAAYYTQYTECNIVDVNFYIISITLKLFLNPLYHTTEPNRYNIVDFNKNK
jgi:hypothetical protein